jgi:AcrR family transcriptional regulator
MRKGDTTRQQILHVALSQASEVGLEGLSIGGLARDLSMSKSGLFAHFGSKQGLQKGVLDLASDLFVNTVVRPAIRLPRGEQRVTALFANYLVWADSAPVPGGCVFASASFEFDDRPGPVRDVLLEHVADLRSVFSKAAAIAIEVGDFRPGLDPEQFAFDIHAAVLAYHVEARLFCAPDARRRVQNNFDALISAARLADA